MKTNFFLRRVISSVVLFLLFIMNSTLLYAEGTKELRPTSTSQGYLLLDPTWGTFARYGCPQNTRLNISVCNPGEKIYYGVRQNNGDVKFRISYDDGSANGVVVVPETLIPTSGAGYIGTYTQAVTGPIGVFGVPAATGYTPRVFTPAQTGTYFLEFLLPTGNPQREIEHFDITVTDAANNRINGRVWSQEWAFTTRNFTNPFAAKLYVYSDDGIVTSLNFNGMQPYAFNVSCNQTGVANSGNLFADRQSTYGNSTYPQYKIFLNNPDILCFPNGVFGQVIGVPTITGCGNNRCVNIVVDKAGQAAITLDINGVNGYQPNTSDRQFIVDLVVGTNCIPWDGLDGQGNPLVDGQSLSLQIDYFNGITHLPLFDVEANPNGFIVQLVRPAPPPGAPPVPALFWDDSNITTGTALDGLVNLTGCSSGGGCHKWTGRGVNNSNSETINTWWYANIIRKSLTYRNTNIFTDADIRNTGTGVANDTSLCGIVNPIQLAGNVTGATGGVWSSNGTGTFTSATAMNAKYTPSAADITKGKVTIKLTSTGNGVCPPSVDSLRITFVTKPTANAGSPITVCSNNPSATLSGSFTNAGGAIWSGGAGSYAPVNTATNATYTLSAGEVTAGSVTLTLTTTGNGICPAATSTVKITSQAAPTANAGTAQSVCKNNANITLAGTVTNATSQAWSGGGGSFNPNANTLNAVYTPSASELTTGNVTLTLTANRAGCNAVNSVVTFTFQAAPVVNAGPDQSVCSNNAKVTLAGTITNGSGPVWSGGAGSYSPGANTLNPTYTPTTSEINNGSLTLTLTGSRAGCLPVTDQVKITFTSAPIANAGVDGSVCANNANFILNGSVTGATGGTWQGGGGSFTPSANALNATYIPSAAEKAAGLTALVLSTTGNGNCNAVTDTVALIITPAPTANAGANKSVCANNPAVTLSGSATSASAYTWTGGTGTFTPNNTTLTPTYTPSVAEITAGTITLTLSANRPTCTAVTSQMTISITPPPTANAGADQTLCSNNAVVTLNGSVTGATGGKWTGGSGTYSPNNTTLNATYSPTVAEISAGSVTLTLTTTGNGICNAVTDQVNITFTTAPTVNANTDQSVCANNPNVTLNGAVTVATGGTWTGGGTFSPNANALNAVYTPSAAEISAGTATLTLTTTGNGNCNAVSDQMKITITPAPTVNAGTNQTVCAANPAVTLAGSVTVATGGTWTGGAGTYSAGNNSLNSVYTPTVAEINAGVVNLTLTTTGNGNCNAVSGNLKITINPAPTADAGPDQTVCGSVAGVSLAGKVTGATGGKWTTSGSGSFSSTTALNSTYTPSAADKTAGTVVLTLTTTGNGVCTAVSDQMTINITPVPTINAGPNQIVCSNDLPVKLNGAGSPATWSGGSGTYNPGATALNAVYTPSAAEIAAGTVTLTLTTNASGACPVVSSNVTITIPKGPIANAGPDQTLCGNSSSTMLSGNITNAAGGLWSSSGTGTFSPNANTLNAQYIPSATDKSNGTVTLTLSSTGNGSCTGTTDNMVLTITPAVTVNAGPNQTVCATQASYPLNGSVTGATGGTWTTSGSGTFAPNANTLNATYTPSSGDKTAGTVTLTLTTTGNGSCPALTSQAVYTIVPAPTVDAGPDQSICSNIASVSLNGTSSTGTAQWTSSGTGTFSPSNATLNATYVPSAADKSAASVTLTLTSTGGTACSAITDQMVVSFTPSPTVSAGTNKTVCANSGPVSLNGSVTVATGGAWTTNGDGAFANPNAVTTTYTLGTNDIINGVVTLTLTSTGNGTCNAASDKIVITITPAPTVDAGIDRSVCVNNATLNLNGAITIATGGVWSGGTGTFTPANTALNATYTPSPAEMSAGSVTLTLTSTGNGLCNAVSDQMKIAITPAPTADAGVDKTICADSAYLTLNGAYTVASGGIWTSSGNGTFFPNSSTPNANYTPSATDRSNGNVILTFTTTGNGTCNAVSDQMTITITPAPTVNPGSNQTVCANKATVTLTGSATIAAGGTWSTSGTGTFANPNALNTTYTPSVLDKTSGSVTLTLTTTGNGSCKATSGQMTVNITPAPVVNAGPDQSVCANNPNFSLNGSVTVATGGIWKTSGTGIFTPSATTLNATYNPSVADITAGTVTLTLTSTGNGLCNQVSDQMLVTITPAPTVNAGSDATICANSSAVLNGSKTVATGASWTTSGTGTFTPNATVLNASYVPSPADTSAKTVTLTLTTTGNGNCNAVSSQKQVTIAPVPVIDAGPDLNTCGNSQFVKLDGKVYNAGGGKWTSSGTGTFGPATTTLNATYTPSATENAGGIVTLTLTSTGNGACAAVSDQMNIKIDPVPSANAGSNQTLCANNSVATLNGTVTNATGGAWYTSGSGTFANDLSLSTTYTPSAADITAGSVMLTLGTLSSGSCNMETSSITLTFTPAPSADAGPDQTICANNAIVSLNGNQTVASGAKWTSSGTGTFANASALNTTYTPSAADIASGTVNLTLTTTGNGSCSAVWDPMTVTITPAPVVNAGTAQAVCETTGGVILTGTVTNATGGTWSTASGTGSFAPNANTLNATFIPSASQIANGQAVLTLTSTGNGNCLAVSSNVTIAIQKAPSANAGSDVQVCAGTPGINLNGFVNNAAGGTWTTNGSGTFTPGPNSLNATYTPSAAENVNGSTVILTLTTTGNGVCAAAADQMTVSFTTTPVNAGPDQTVCSNSLPVQLNGSGNGTWSGGTGTFSDPNSLSTSYAPGAGEIPGTVTLTLTGIAVGSCIPGMDQVTITIIDGPKADAGADQTTCTNNPVINLAGIISNASGAQWTTEGSGAFSASNNVNTTYTASAADIAAGSVKISITTTGNGICVAATDTMTILFTPAPVVNAGSDQTSCANAGDVSLNGKVTIATGGTWSVVTGSGSVAAPNSLTTNYTPSASDITSGSVTLRLTSTGNGICPAVTDDMIINFGPAPAANAGADQTVCADTSGITLNGSVTIAPGGVWTTTGTGLFTPNASALNAKYTPSSADTAAKTVSLILTTTGNGNCIPVSDTMQLTITPAPTVNAGPAQTVCADITTIALSGTTTVASGATWTSSGTGTFANANALSTNYTPSAADKAAKSVTLRLTTTGNGTCKAATAATSIVFTPAPTANAGSDQSGCVDVTKYTLNGQVTVATGGSWSSSGSGTFANANALSTTYSPSAADLSTGSVTLTLTTTGNGTCNPVTDQMLISFTPAPTANAGTDRNTCANRDTIVLGGSYTISSGAKWTSSGTGTFSPSATAMNATYYMSAADKTAGNVTITLTTTGNGTCNAVSDQAIISIAPAPVVSAGSDQTLCKGQGNLSLNGSVLNAGGGTWTTNGTGTFTPDANTLNAVYTPSATDNAKGGIILTLTSTSNGTCLAQSDVMAVNIIPSPSAVVNAGYDQTVCMDIARVKLNGFVSNAGGGLWSSAGTGTFSPDVNTLDAAYIPSAADKSSGSVVLTLTTVNNGVCNAVTDQMTITFTPAPTAVAGPNQNICADAAGVATLNGSVTVATGGIWTTSGTGAFAPNATALNAVYHPSAQDKANGSVGLTLTTTGNGTCNAVSSVMTVKITKAPTINAGADKTVCANVASVNISASITGATGATWTSSGTGSFSNANLRNTFYLPSSADTASRVISLTVKTTGNGVCAAESDQLLINFAPVPVVNAGPDQTICTVQNSINLSGYVTHAAGATWSTSGSGSFSNAGDLNASYSPSASDKSNGTVILRLTSFGNGSCNAIQDTMILNIQSGPVVDAGSARVCLISAGAPLNGTVTNAAGGNWSTSGSGVFGPNPSTLNATYYPSMTDASAGSVTLTLTSTGNGSCAAASNQTVLVIAPMPLADAGQDIFICKGSSTSLEAATSADVTYNWSAGGVSFSSTPVTTVTVNSATDYALTVTDSRGCSSFDTVRVNVYDLPTFNMGNSYCLSDTLILDSKAVNLPAVPGVFQWYKDGQIMTGQNAPVLSPNDAGTYRIVYSYGNCAVGASANVTAPPALKSMMLLGCENSNAAITIGSDVSPVTYTWNTSPQQSGTNLSTINITIPKDTSYFTAVVTDAKGCSSRDSVMVIGVPVPVIALNNLSSCQGKTEILNGRPANIPNVDNYNPAWEWKKDGVLLTNTNDSLSVTASGTYTLNLTIGQCSTPASSVVTFNPIPGVNLPETMKFCKETENIKIIDAGAGTGYTYLWKAPAGIVLDSSNTQKIAIRNAGKYVVTVTNNFNCTAKDSVQIEAICPPRVFVPNAFIPDAPGEDQRFKVFGDHFSSYKLMVFNRWGEVIYVSTDRNESWDGKYRGEPMPVGVYNWVVTYEGVDPEFKGPYTKEGSVTIIR